MPATRALTCVALLVAVGCEARHETTIPTATHSAVSAPVVPLIEVTAEAATSVLQHIATTPEAADCYLRVRVVPGGCQGFMHKLDLDPVVSADDHTFESGSVKVVVLTRQIELLRGTKVGFGQEAGRAGFTVENPNFKGDAAKRSMEILEQAPIAK